jgi:hypothetical protein
MHARELIVMLNGQEEEGPIDEPKTPADVRQEPLPLPER